MPSGPPIDVKLYTEKVARMLFLEKAIASGDLVNSTSASYKGELKRIKRYIENIQLIAKVSGYKLPNEEIQESAWGIFAQTVRLNKDEAKDVFNRAASEISVPPVVQEIPPEVLPSVAGTGASAGAIRTTNAITLDDVKIVVPEAPPSRRQPTWEQFIADFELFALWAIKVPYRRGFGAHAIEKRSGPLILGRAQKIVVSIIMRQFFMNKVPTRLQILKARQLGMTTVLVAFWTWLAIQFNDFTMMFIIDKIDHLREKRSLIIHWLEIIAEMYPREAPVIIEKDSKHIKLSNGFRFLFESGESPNPGTSEKIDGLHMSERPKWPKGRSSEIMTSIQPGLSTGPFSIVVDESTAEGFDDFYKDWKALHEEGASALTNTIPVFFPWFISDEYTQEPPSTCFDADGEFIYRDDETIFAETDADGAIVHTESEYAKMYNLSPGQVYWRRVKIGSPPPTGFRGDKEMFNQEYPTTPEHAWSVVGSRFVAATVLRKAREALGEPVIVGNIIDGSIVDGKRRGNSKLCNDYSTVVPVIDQHDIGHLKIYQHPERNRMYFIGGDVCEGLQVQADGKSDPDWTAAVVLDEFGFVVAVYRSRVKPEDFALILILLGVYYNNAKVNCERNKDGATVWSWFYPSGYTNIYYREDSKGFGFVSDLAWSKIVADQRIEVLNTGRAAIHEEPARVVDETLLNEASSLRRRKDGKVEPFGGHDDVYLAYCHAETCRVSDVGHAVRPEDIERSWTFSDGNELDPNLDYDVFENFMCSYGIGL